MAEISTIARPYATAIFNLAKENKSLSNWSNMLSLLSNVVSDSQIKDFIADSKVLDSDREKVILKICKDKIDKSVENLIKLLIENKRLKAQNGSLYFVAVKSTAFEFMEKVNFVNEIGRDNFFDSKAEAINVLYDRLDKSKCEKCQALVFKECN